MERIYISKKQFLDKKQKATSQNSSFFDSIKKKEQPKVYNYNSPNVREKLGFCLQIN